MQQEPMTRDEEFGPDRGFEFETDDEENDAQRVCDVDDEDSESEAATATPSRSSSSHCGGAYSPPWPQSYRQSMDMFTSATPPSVNFLRGRSFMSFIDKTILSPVPESSLNKPLICEPRLDIERAPISKNPVKASGTSDVKSFRELPPPQKCSYAQSFINAMNILCGIGLLTTPYAIKEGGWSSLFVLFIFGLITCYTGILLKRCLESSPGLQTYPDIGQVAFGAAGRIFIATVLYIELYSSCVEYLIMMSDNLSSLFPNNHIIVGGIQLHSYQIWAITSTLVILPTVWLRNLRLLSYVSVGGVITLVLVVLCLFWVGTVDQVEFHPSGTVLNLSNLPVAVGLFGFCYGGHSVFPNIYSSMKEPSRFSSVLLSSFALSWILYTGVAIFGFLMFGDSIKSQFTLNMPPQLAASKVAAWTVVVAPLSKYALTMTPVAFSLEELLPLPKLRSYSLSIIIRTILVISTLVIALTVPYFGSLMALIGSLLVMLISVVFPCACYLRILRGKLTRLEIGISTFIMIVGVVCSGLGSYSAISGMADRKA